ncbi:MAG: hypothetical protein HC915_15310 [Anaerolineae bacterium]|nr:hypothetical protein [Anaerolineae bacterium]
MRLLSLLFGLTLLAPLPGWAQPADPPPYRLAVVESTPTGDELWLMDPTGAARSLLFQSVNPIIALSWSPDGDALALMTEEEMSGQIRLLRQDLPAPGATPPAPQVLPLAPQALPIEVVWSPDGAWLAVTCYCGDGGADLYRLRPDGSDPQRLTTFPNASEVRLPRWSPEGEWLALHVLGPQGGLYRVRVEGSDLEQLAEGHSTDVAASWSPDGAWLAYRALPEAEPELHLLNVDTGERAVLDAVRFGAVAWSPEGEWLALSAQVEGVFGVFRLRPDGSDLERLAEGFVQGLSWSPAGTPCSSSSQIPPRYCGWTCPAATPRPLTPPRKHGAPVCAFARGQRALIPAKDAHPPRPDDLRRRAGRGDIQQRDHLLPALRHLAIDQVAAIRRPQAMAARKLVKKREVVAHVLAQQKVAQHQAAPLGQLIDVPA